jgi:hypothetical protein
MSESSTLIYLINQIKAEFLDSCLQGEDEKDPELSELPCLTDYSPSSRSVQAILEYDRILEVTDTELLGKVEWVLN